MRKSGCMAFAAAMLTASAACAAGQGKAPPQPKTQDGGAQSPGAGKSGAGKSEAGKSEAPKSGDEKSTGEKAPPQQQSPGQNASPDQTPGQNPGQNSGQPGQGETQKTGPGENQEQHPGPGENQPTVTVFDRLEVQGILGKEVRSPANENMGRIVDVIVDRSGQVRAAIIDFGGFLGVGNRRVAVAWNALHFPPDLKDPRKVDRIGLDLTRDQVQSAPEYKEDKPVVVLGASGGLESLPFP